MPDIGTDLVQNAFERTSGAPLIPGNALRVLLDGEQNYGAWLAAIRAAQSHIFFENYIIEEDDVGREFAEALAERARAGVKVLLLRDWLGSYMGASRGFWRRLGDAGVELRVFNPPALSSPFGWISRDHRKLICIDGQIGFVSGLCVSQKWLGDPLRGIAPWRDTGVELRGPAAASLERAFKQVWDVTGACLPEAALTRACDIARQGEVGVRVIAGEPSSSDLFRLDLLITAAAQRTLWLTDAYFVGFAPYVQALRRAACAGVDVRLLVPSTSDLALISPLSRAGYRPLLETGVRVFEWNGSMVHAKTATADGRWARVGSSNLNLASFIGNYELDLAIEDATIASQLEAIYLTDLANSTEITLRAGRVLPAGGGKRTRRGSRARAVGAVRFANAVGAAAASGTRVLGAVETSFELGLAGALVVLSGLAVLWPAAVAYPVALVACWLAITFLLRARRNAHQRRSDRETAHPAAKGASLPSAGSSAD